MEKTQTAKSSISEKTEIPKHKNALEEKYETENKTQHQKEVDSYERLKTKETSKLPQPTGWRLLVLPFKLPEKTKGGLLLGADTLERQQVASPCGPVLSMGPYLSPIHSS